VAIAAAKAGAACAVAAETDELALTAIDLNSQANDVFVEPIGNNVIGLNARWNTVLAGDMFYERPLAERLVPWLRRLAREGIRVLVGDPGRHYFPTSGVRKLASFSVPTTLELEDRERKDAAVYQLTE
jgi:predicted nicotinamide N-methyase